jgi:hypothetical protein
MSRSIYSKLFSVQQKLRVPKDRKNAFGGYSFRNAADILEKAKPYLEEVKAIVILSDEIFTLGSESRYTNTDPKSPYSGKDVLSTPRYYLKAKATFIDVESGESVEVFGEAREEETKKGMDAAQLTGACSSYARKYALCGLFAIDDSSLDPDETNDHGKDKPTNSAKSAPTSASKPLASTRTPQATKTAQNGSAVPSALREKAKEAWKIFNELESVKSMDDQSRTKFFRSTLKSKVGKEDPAKLSTDDWDKVIREFDMMRVI